MNGSKQSSKQVRKDFLVYVARHGGKLFIFIYDRELIENKKSCFRSAKFNLECSEEELEELMKESISINFFGKKSVKKGIEKGYVHPEGISEIDGIPCAISIKMTS